MSAVHDFNKMFKILGFYANLVGISIVFHKETYIVTRTTKQWVGMLIFLMVCWLNTVIVADTTVMCRSCAIMPLIIQGLVKFNVFVRYWHGVMYKLVFLRRIYKMNPHPKAVNFRAVQKWSTRILFVVQYAWIPISSTGILFLAVPVWKLLHGERILLIDIWIVGIDHRTHLGYVLHCALHVATIALAIAGTLGADLMLVTLIMHVWPMTDIWGNMWRRMNRALVRPPKHMDERARHAYFRNMLDIHRDINTYLQDMARYFENMTFCEVFTDCGMLCMLLYCYIMLNWREAAIMGFMILIKLLMYGILGTLVELAADRIYINLLLNNWYMLPVEEQRILLIVLSTAQRPQLLKAGTLPLNLDTTVKALKTVYSVAMLLTKSEAQ